MFSEQFERAMVAISMYLSNTFGHRRSLGPGLTADDGDGEQKGGRGRLTQRRQGERLSLQMRGTVMLLVGVSLGALAGLVTISTLPTPQERDYCGLGTFGPHNVPENRPGSFRSEETIFATYNNAGVRVFDIRDAFAPK